MAESGGTVERERQMIVDAKAKGTASTFLAYTKLSGPGWLQSAITLGGGSLAGSLYLGVIGGYQMMWLQPLMMILGIVMLSAIGYVALSTDEKPFQAINRHVNPVLGWGWAIATLMANLVWAMPQFSLGTAALQQNLGIFASDDYPKYGSLYCAILLFVAGAVVIWFYDSGGWGIKLFEIILKIMVAVVVLSFLGVVVTMTLSNAGLPWSEILAGFVPNLNLLFEPADKLQEFIAASSNPEYWQSTVLSTQRDLMVTAAATAVGINMTFLLPYSMLKRGWDKDFRGLATFDLSTGLFIPFVVATSCVVIASASQFHGQYDAGLLGEAPATDVTTELEGAYNTNLDGLLKEQLGAEKLSQLSPADRQSHIDQLPKPDKQISAMLVKRDAFLLADSLEHLSGKNISQTVFGIGVLGMAVSTIIILMLINGFTICEMLGLPSEGLLHRFGCLLPGITGAVGFLLLWGDAKARFWLAVPTSVFGMVLLPIAYITFFLMMNNRGLLGDNLPRGGKRVAVNVTMLIALLAASVGAGWSIWSKAGWVGVGLVAAFMALTVVVHFVRSKPTAADPKGTA